ncbi:hypothetical protein [Halarchaeum acidiphilum]|uniref:hypothetical protein n=1 Tax=Halarchaeum acidiphilum TaxID=489138 RepID=UPI0011DD4974|nr:hypothetical protein [Halarchaeum acidiphilum]
MVRGPRSGTKIGWAIGVAAAIIGFLGYFVFGWRFSSGNGGISSGIGLLIAVIAVVLALYRNFSK